MKFLTFENLFKLGTLAGLAAILYLNAHYITKETFETHVKDQTRFQEEIAKTTSGIATSIALLQQNATMLADHEQRIRSLERRP